MFRKSRTEEATAKVQDATARTGRQIREKVVPAIGAKAHDAKQWATPHVERGMEAAAPRVEAAVDRVSPAVDATRDKIVEDLLPRLVDAVHAAAAAGATAGAASQVAQSRGHDAYSVLRGKTEVKKHRKGKRKLLLALTALVAAIGAAVAAFKKQAPKDDPWALPAQASTGSDSDAGTHRTTMQSTGTTSGAGTTGGSDVPGLRPESAAAQDAPTTAAQSSSADTSSTPTPEALRKSTKKPAGTALDQPQGAERP